MTDARSLHRQQFGTPAETVVRAPGRINLIGDHTDYCGLPVLPMAIEQAVHVAVARSADPGIRAFSSLDAAPLESAPPWAKYVRAVWHEVTALRPDAGVTVAIDGDLPATGGLSSSSALSVGCLLAFDRTFDLGLDVDQVIDLALAAERKAAIAGGAMDQTVIALAEPGNALRIDFDPVARRHVPVPDTFAWIAGYSGQRAPKGESAADSYNSFVLASRAAAAALGAPYDGAPPLLSRIPDVTHDDIAGLPKVTVAEAAAMSGGATLGLDSERVLDLAVSAGHVLSEAGRVDAAEAAIRAGDRAEMGRLMLDSHSSLRDYGSSTPALDRLVEAAVAAGADGARVTGAGFGGWAIALAPAAAAPAVQGAMHEACGGPTFLASPAGGVLWSLRTG